MSIEECFELKKENRVRFIEKNIVEKLPENERELAETRAIKLADNYVGVDVNALSILSYAAVQGRFGEFAEKLEKHYRKSLSYVHPEARKVASALTSTPT